MERTSGEGGDRSYNVSRRHFQLYMQLHHPKFDSKSLIIEDAKSIPCEFYQQLAAQYRDLTNLQINSSLPTSTGFYFLNTLKQLKTLNLAATSIDDDDLISILQNNSNLEDLIIDRCASLKNLSAIASTLAKFNKKLKTFSCNEQGTPSLSSLGLMEIAKCHHLEKLSLKYCLKPYFYYYFKRFKWNCPRLEEVEIRGWDNVDDDGLICVLHTLKNLQFLDIRRNREITPNVINMALECIQRLTIITVDFESLDCELVEKCSEKYPFALIENIPLKRLTQKELASRKAYGLLF